MKKESVLNSLQLEHIEIEHFIFHVILPDRKDNPVEPLNEVVLTPSQKAFFTARLKESAQGTQFVFLDDADHLKSKCTELLAAPAHLVTISRQLAVDFAGRHKGNMAPGVFVIAIAKTIVSDNRPISFVFLAKLDNKLVYRYFLEESNGGTRARMEEVTNSLVEDKSAIQKSALIDITDSFLWDVLAWERKGKADGDLTDYFKGFLGVKLREHASELTRRAVATVRLWARAIDSADLPTGESAHTIRQRAAQYMKDHDSFDTDDFINTVIRDEVVDRKQRLSLLLKEKLSEEGISGQIFRPQPNSLPKKAQRLVYETVEGVRIELSQPKEDCGVTIEDNDTGTTITIKTSKLLPKDEG